MTIVAQSAVRVALCGHEYAVPHGTRGRRRKVCSECETVEEVSLAAEVRTADTDDGFRSCAGCGDLFKIGARDRNPRKWCSAACSASAYRLRNPEYVERQKRLSAERHRKQYSKPSHVLQCAHCGDSFTTSHKKMYCSRSCSNGAYAARRRSDGRAADMSAKRRALEVGVKIQAGRRLAVLEADNWICHLCGLATNRDAVYPADDYPVIDHVVPLSKGGEHSPSNWKTAHSICNMRKGDMSLEDYLTKFPM